MCNKVPLYTIPKCIKVPDALPDNMLAMQEIYLIQQGMADMSRHRMCLSSEVKPVVTAGNKEAAAWSAIRFFCSRCGCVSDNMDRDPDFPCPIPDAFLASMRKIAPGMQAFNSKPMDMGSLQEPASYQWTERAWPRWDPL